MLVNKLQGNKSILEQTVKLVNEFYQLDCVSRQAPGRKDLVAAKHHVQKCQERHHVQKRQVFCSLREIYAMFVKDNPIVNIGFSKYCSPRPVNVMLSSIMPREACLCLYLNKKIPHLPVYSGNLP